MFQRLAIRTHWEKGQITYRERRQKKTDTFEMDVSYMPGTRKNIAVDGDGRFYLHNNKKRGWARVHGSIFDLERMLWNIVRKERREVLALEQIEALACALHVDIVTIPFGTTEDQTKLSDRFATLADPLKFARTETKKEAYGQFYCCVLVRDSKGRLNRGMLRARTLAAFNRLVARIAEILEIEPRIMVWLGEVQLVARDVTFLLNSIAKDLHGCIAMLENPTMPMPATAVMDRILRDVAQLNVRPFGTLKSYLGRECDAVYKAIIEKNRNEALRILRRSYNSVLLKQERVRLQWLLLNFSMLRYDGKETQPLIAWLWGAHSRLARIDETGFKKPVVAVV